jgi:hypothetical protein
MADEIRRETNTGASAGQHGSYAGGYSGSPSYGGAPSYGSAPSGYGSSGYGGGSGGTTYYSHSPAPDTLKSPMFRRVSWGAIFAGTFVALALSALLWLLGAAVGLAAFDPRTPPGEGWAWGIGIWGIVVAIVSLFIGGVVAAWLAGLPKWMDAMLHGLVVWGLATTAGFLLTGILGATVFGGMAAMGPQMTMQPQQTGSIFATQGMRDDPYGQVRSELSNILPTDDGWFGGWGRETERQYTERDLDAMVMQIQQGRGQQIVGILVRDGEMDPQMAQRRVRQWEQVLQSGPQQRVLGTPEQRQPGQQQQGAATDREAVDAATAAATWGFFALLLGACAAAVGGAIGRPAYLEDRITEGGHPRFTPANYQQTNTERGYGHSGQSGYSSGEHGRYNPPPSY